MKHIYTFDNFLFEGGNALDITRRIKQHEVQATLDSIADVVFPVLGLSGFGTDAILVGSAGMKPDLDDESGDIDVGVPLQEFCDIHSVDNDLAVKYIYDLLSRRFPEFQIRWMRGIDVVSMSYPIKGDPTLGYVQVDFIPVRDVEWSKFIYRPIDKKTNDSAYKSAHRNWLFSAILSSLDDDYIYDELGNVREFSTYSLRLNDGLYRTRKSYVGKNKLLKNPYTIKEYDIKITSSPKDLVELLFGKGTMPNNVGTFESCYSIMTKPDYKFYDKMDDITDSYVKLLTKAKLQIPNELKKKNGPIEQ